MKSLNHITLISYKSTTVPLKEDPAAQKFATHIYKLNSA